MELVDTHRTVHSSPEDKSAAKCDVFGCTSVEREDDDECESAKSVASVHLNYSYLIVVKLHFLSLSLSF